MTVVARRIGGFLSDRNAAGAVEFALVLPFLLLLYIGCSELTVTFTVERKVEHTAATINDLISQSSSLTAAEIDGIYNIAPALMAPYASRGLGMRVTSVAIDAAGKQTVSWSCGRGGMPSLAKTSIFALPARFSGFRSLFMLVTETTYTFKLPTGIVFDKTITSVGKSYLTPRVGTKVDSPGC